jgi:hypothetical protein
MGGTVARMEAIGNAYKIFVVKPEVRIRRGRPRRKPKIILEWIGGIRLGRC